jgi:hypothetical protein
MSATTRPDAQCRFDLSEKMNLYRPGWLKCYCSHADLPGKKRTVAPVTIDQFKRGVCPLKRKP